MTDHPYADTTANAEMLIAATSRTRLADLLRRHVRAEDIDKTDRAFIEAVFARWRRDAEAEHGDPNA